MDVLGHHGIANSASLWSGKSHLDPTCDAIPERLRLLDNNGPGGKAFGVVELSHNLKNVMLAIAVDDTDGFPYGIPFDNNHGNFILGKHFEDIYGVPAEDDYDPKKGGDENPPDTGYGSRSA